MAGSPQAGHTVSLTWQRLLLALLEALCYSHVSGSWKSSLPGTIRALKGSCVVIPCSFTYPGSRESLGGPFSVVWYQYRSWGYPEIYNSKGPASVLAEYQARTQLLGDPEMGNCTLSLSPVRSEDALSYYVWINPDSVRHRFYDITVRVEVADTPDPLMLSDPGVLIEGHRTTITCSIRHTCPSAPPSLGWSPRGGKAVTRQEQLVGGDWRAELELSYTPSYKDHGQYLQCTATFPNQQQARNGLHLQVKYRPRGTAVAVVGPARLKEGDNVTLRCTSQSHPPATTYRWFQGPRRTLLRGLGRGPEVTVLAVGRHSGPYRCAAENEIGLGEDSPAANLDVEYPPELLPRGNCTVRGRGPGGAATCHCTAEGNPPPRLEWRLANRTLPGDFEGPELRATSWARGPAVSGELRGPAGALANVSCAVTNAHGQSQAALPVVPAGDDNLLLMVSSGVIGSVLLLSVLAIVVYKVARARKDEEEGPSIYDNEGNGEQRPSLKGGKPSKMTKDEQFNLYSKAKAGGEELGIDDYEAMERVEDYENLAAGGAGHYGNVGTWQPHVLSEQIYSNV
ncbi:sialic acid-binding Ig-like lectin 10 [Gopherus flavomarginatus]|uniref:sialic acid-binding Ig-like lectin 10 n=1 Tax=Gopherus flavomarginatus TaxID=286002 RepID=UPI0021CBFC5D|nr:sialic acid-binding Ig-like lectin 10 [Gopherus flavomarginatus]